MNICSHLPFYNLDNYELFSYTSQHNDSDYGNFNIEQLDVMTFKQFDINNDNSNFNQDLIESFFVNNSSNIEDCNYYFVDSLNDKLKLFKNSDDFFSVFLFNINSVPSNFDSFKIECLDRIIFDFNVIGLVETKLINEIEQLYDIPNYNKITNNRNRHGGGLALFVKDNYKFNIRDDLNKQLDHIETLFVEIDLKNKRNIICGVVYRRPGSNINNFISDYEILLENINRENKNVYLMGDFNINLLSAENCNLVESFVNLNHGRNLVSLINKPTRVTPNSATIIDHIWTNEYSKVNFSGVIHDNISDHFPVFSVFKLSNGFSTCSKIDNETVTYREFNDSNFELFEIALSNVNWSLICNISDPNVSYNNFDLILSNLFNKYFPVKIKKYKRRRKDKPYINNEIKSLIKEKNKLHKKYVKHPITYNNDFKQIRNRLTDTIRKSKANYYNNKLNETSGDSRKTWGVINEIIRPFSKNSNNLKFFSPQSPDIEILDPKQIADGFNNYYSNVGPQLSNAIPDYHNSYLDYLENYVHESMSFSEVSENDVVKMGESLNDVAAGCDDLPGKVIKKIINLIKTPITHIFNCSLSTGIFPDKLKIAKVTPIYKKGNKEMFSNYRPISVLPVISKLLEKIVYNKLEEHLQTNNILANEQHGFCKNKSTTTAVLSLTDEILKSFENKEYVVGVFIDLAKAFETVNHSILLGKLRHYGIRGTPLIWFESYLSNRSQFVKYKNSCSSHVNITHSVPQGSLLGPILFNIYINDIIKSFQHLKSILYADDSCLYSSNKNICTLLANINSDLSLIEKWLGANKLTLNINKSHYIIFKNRKTLPNDIGQLVIGGQNLERVSDTDFLGVVLQDNLSWKKHIQKVNKKINKYCSIFYLTRKYLTKQTLKTLYFSVVYPSIIYCNIVWGNTNKCNINKLVACQKSLIRIIMNRTKYSHTNNDFRDLKI